MRYDMREVTNEEICKSCKDLGDDVRYDGEKWVPSCDWCPYGEIEDDE